MFTIKWFFFFNTDTEIDLITRLIFEIKDWQYFTLIFNFSNLNFNPSYNPALTDLKFISFPIYSIIYHSLFIIFFNIYGFIIIEFFIILLFFHILFNFFKKIGIDAAQAIFLTLLIFCLPNIIDFLQLGKIQYFGAVKELYNLRIPRPSISHLYLFLFFLLLTSNKKKTPFNFRQLSLMGIIFAFMFGSYYYNLAISGLTLIMYYFYITHQSNQKIIKYLKDCFTVVFFFLLFSIPLILILLNTEPDYLIRVGLVELDIAKKIILLNHFIKQILSIKFLIIFSLITLLHLFLKKKKVYKLELINLLYFIFLSSFFAPLIFIIISPTISEPYHFTNMLVSVTFFILLTFSFLILFFFIKDFTYGKNLLNTAIILLLFFYGFDNYLLNKKNHDNLEQIKFYELIKEININKDSSVLTFDARVQTYLILNNFKNLINVIGVNTSLDDETMENNIINIFKFLNLTVVEFNNFIKNEKHGWRFINKHIGETFLMKYQANKLTTYRNSKDFTSVELKYIAKSSPLHSQQIIIPTFEIERLTNKFINFSKKEDLNPDLIIININDIITQNIILDNEIYCSKNINKSYIIYFNKKYKENC